MAKSLSTLRKLAMACTFATMFSFVAQPVFAQEEKQPEQEQKDEQVGNWSPLQSWVAAEYNVILSNQMFEDPTPNNILFDTFKSYFPDTKVVGLNQLKQQYKENPIKTNDMFARRRLIVIGINKSVRNLPGSLIELDMTGGGKGDETQTVYFRAMPKSGETAVMLSNIPYAAVNCRYDSTDKGFVLRDCQYTKEIENATFNTALKIRKALDGESTDPMAISDAVQIEYIVNKLSDQNTYPDMAEKCVQLDEGCATAIDQVLKDSKVRLDKEQFVEILCHLGYSKEDAEKYFDEQAKNC